MQRSLLLVHAPPMAPSQSRGLLHNISSADLLTLDTAVELPAGRVPYRQRQRRVCEDQMQEGDAKVGTSRHCASARRKSQLPVDVNMTWSASRRDHIEKARINANQTCNIQYECSVDIGSRAAMNKENRTIGLPTDLLAERV